MIHWHTIDLGEIVFQANALHVFSAVHTCYFDGYVEILNDCDVNSWTKNWGEGKKQNLVKSRHSQPHHWEHWNTNMGLPFSLPWLKLYLTQQLAVQKDGHGFSFL
jgi:hypothetical protein